MGWVIAFVVAVLVGAVGAGESQDAVSAYLRQDYPTAVRIIRPLADQGNSSAQFYVGVHVRHRPRRGTGLCAGGQGVQPRCGPVRRFGHRGTQAGGQKNVQPGVRPTPGRTLSGHAARRRLAPARPAAAMPMPTNTKVAGSGTGAVTLG